MKKLFLALIILFISIEISAQVDTIPFPPGYTALQLRNKNMLRISPDDHIWVGFRNIGAAEYDGSTWTMYNDSTGWPIKNANAFAFDGAIKWIGTDSGVVKIDGVNITTYNMLNSPLPSNKINYLFFDDTTLWIATYAGAISFDGANWNIYNKSNSSLSSDTIYYFNKNSFGVYATDKQNYIYLFRSNNWKYIGRNAFPVYGITSDKSGHLFTSYFQIYDTLLIPVEFQSDPCLYGDNLMTHPYSVLGGSNPNETYAISEAVSFNSHLLKFDSQLNLTKAFGTDNNLLYDALGYSHDARFFDFNSAGEIISIKGPFSPDFKIYRTNTSGLNQLPAADTCPYLDINQVRARIWNNGSMFWDLVGSSLYEVPKGSGKTAIFAEGLWIGGRDGQEKIHMAAQTYRQSGRDFWPGPLDTTTATVDTSTLHTYDKIWKIERYTINDFIFNYQNGNVANGTYIIPDIILNWPAHGTGNISRSLAPFVDNNNDGNYNPIDGDYPEMKGDQMLWWVFNDNERIHGKSESDFNLGVEIHGSAYAYNCPALTDGDTVINYTTFYHYDFYNRSDTSYHDVYSGIYNDVELGYYLDDFVGCDTSNDIAFAYNGDDDDDNGYGLHPPMMNLAFLDGPEAVPNDAIDNNHNGTTDEPGEHCMMNYFINWNDNNPVSSKQYYWRLQGLWYDSSRVAYGTPDGIDPFSTNSTNYMFSGPPYDTINGWSEGHICTGCPPNIPHDRRIFVSSGPYDLPAHGKRSLDYAYVYTREPRFPNGPNTSLAVNQDQVIRIKHFFETDSFPCVHLIGIDEIKKHELNFSLFPVPAHSEINVSVLKDEPGERYYYVTDITGRIIVGSTKFHSSNFKINISSMRAGVYFIHIQSKSSCGVRKFIVE